MRDYDEPTTAMPAEPEPDPRVIAMQRVVDLEQQSYTAERESERRQKQAAVVREELAQAREELRNLLGFAGSGDDSKNPSWAMLR